MKSIFLVRHAKSSWEDSSLSDFDRPLNKRGTKDAPFMAKTLIETIDIPDTIYSSPAKRAFTTAIIFADTFNYDTESIISDMNIYDAGVSDLIRIINSVNDDKNSIMIFGHNPALTMTSNFLSNKYIDNIPTCGIVKIDFDFNDWTSISGNTGTLVLFEYPKKYK